MGEVGQEAKRLLHEKAARARTTPGDRIVVFTDKNQETSVHVGTVMESLKKEGYKPVLYADVRVEPTDESFKAAADFSR